MKKSRRIGGKVKLVESKRKQTRKTLIEALSVSIAKNGLYLMADWLNENYGWNFRKSRLEAAARNIDLSERIGFNTDVRRVQDKIESVMKFLGVKLIEPTESYRTISSGKKSKELYYAANDEGTRLREKFDPDKAKEYPDFYVQRIEGRTIVFDTKYPLAIYELTRNHQFKRYIALRKIMHEYFGDLDKKNKATWIVELK